MLSALTCIRISDCQMSLTLTASTQIIYQQIFRHLDTDRMKEALHPAEKLTDLVIFQNLITALISKRTVYYM
jgi:hypothetical protein